MRRAAGQVAVRPTATAVSTGLRERLAERDAAERRVRLRRAVVTALVVVVVAATGWLVLASPVLALRATEVELSGTGTTVDAAAVTAAVEPAVGTPLVRLDLGGLRERLLDIRTVESVTLTRVWPDGLRVDVTPREPVAVAATGTGHVLLDREGVQVTTAEVPPDGLPQVTVPLDGEDATGRALAAVLDVLGGLPDALAAEVAAAGATSSHDVELVLRDGARVRWGGAEESELKAAVLEVLRQRAAAVYDVSVPRSPTTSG